jgi:pyruvate dehydrogenase E1 component
MAMVTLLGKLLADEKIGRYLVPIVPDEARTFGMESLFRKIGIYSHVGQNYEPVDRSSLLYYKEATDGQILEEGISEAGSMASFVAAGTAYSTFDVNMVPFFFFYSMFGFQRIGDMIWAAGDIQARGFLLGATAGRTTLAGEGLQHQDGNSHILALANPSVLAYDPAFAFEIAVIVREGLRRMLEEGQNLVYYLTIGNEFYPMPAMPQGVEEGILKGIYKFSPSALDKPEARTHLLGSGAILNECLKARTLLEENFDVAADVWSVTSYKNLYWDALDTERTNRLNPDKKPSASFLQRQTAGASGVFVAASDYLKALPETIARHLPGPVTVLGTDGYGRSETREALRDFFEVDARHIAFAALAALVREGALPRSVVKKARHTFKIDPERSNPLFV